MKEKYIWIVILAMWFSTAIAVSVGIFVTKSSICLWALLIPASVKVSTKND